METQIDALDITVLKGGGDEVGAWALDNGFLLSPDAPEVLDFYAERSPVFMAARFDAQRAARARSGRRRQHADHGDDPDRRPVGAGAHPRPRPGGGSRGRGGRVPAHRSTSRSCSPADRGVTLERSEAASTALLADLRSDVGMEWLPASMWLTYLQLDADAGDLDYDLAVSQDPR